MKSGFERMRQLATLSVRKKKLSKKEEDELSRSFVSLCKEVELFRKQQERAVFTKPLDKMSKV